MHLLVIPRKKSLVHDHKIFKIEKFVGGRT
jgi:hypothetical protein